MLPHPLFPAFVMLHGSEHPFGHLGSAVLAISPPSVLPIPPAMAFGEGFGALMLHEYHSAAVQTLVCC